MRARKILIAAESSMVPKLSATKTPLRSKDCDGPLKTSLDGRRGKALESKIESYSSFFPVQVRCPHKGYRLHSGLHCTPSYPQG